MHAAFAACLFSITVWLLTWISCEGPTALEFASAGRAFLTAAHLLSAQPVANYWPRTLILTLSTQKDGVPCRQVEGHSVRLQLCTAAACTQSARCRAVTADHHRTLPLVIFGLPQPFLEWALSKWYRATGVVC